MNSSGVTAAGGVGKYLAEWISDGQPSRDLWACDIKRFVDLHNSKKFLTERVTETLGEQLLVLCACTTSSAPVIIGTQTRINAS